MGETEAGLTGFAFLFLLLALRMPVGMALLAVGFVGIAYLNGMRAATATMTSTAYTLSSNYTLIIIPLFVLMGNVASKSGMSRRLFDAAYAAIGHWKGGLASASVIGCAGFAAVSGSSIATAITMGRVAIPEMKRIGYAPRLSTGAIAAGGTLGILIPPSAGFVIYALLTEESIGQLFMAGILPGILLTLLFVLTITIVVSLNPELAPVARQGDGRSRRTAMLGALPLLSVMLISIGGIYLGVFTPVEASGVGALLISVLALAGRWMSLRDFPGVLLESVRTTAMLFLIVIGASVFGPFLALTHLPETLSDSLTALNLGPYGTLILILLAYIVLGTFLEAFAMLVITLPIFIPIVTALQFDLVWFGVLVVIVVEMGMITPPIGINVFVVKGVARDVPMQTIFAGVLPFWIAMMLGLALVVAVPELALMLPATMFR